MNLPEESIGKVMKKEINMKKDPAVELARIFGCLLVVGVHCWINSFGVAIQEQKRNIYNSFLRQVRSFGLPDHCS